VSVVTHACQDRPANAIYFPEGRYTYIRVLTPLIAGNAVQTGSAGV